MAKDWHETFKTWAKPASDTEEDKASRTAEDIRLALRKHPSLQNRRFDVYATGSYRNNTNVRLDSDIDIAAVLRESFFYQLSGSLSSAQLGISAASYSYQDFRRDVSTALRAAFGDRIKESPKAVSLRETPSRLNADVSVFLEHRWYFINDGKSQYITGEEMQPAPGQRIINWHQQHYDRGVEKNDATRRRFKRAVRILKRLRNDMNHSTPSFLLESLVYNAPNTCFNLVEGSYYEDIKATITELWNKTKADASCSGYKEVNAIKPLFSPEQTWTRQQANDFLLAAWRHVDFPSS